MPTKNSMPSFASGSYENILRLISDERVNAPAFIYFTDRECLGFYDTKKVLHTILWDRVINIEQALGDIGEALPDDETLADFVQNTITETNELNSKVESINNTITIITSEDLEEDVLDD